MRPLRKFLCIGALIAAPVLIPSQSRAGLISDLLKDIFGNNDKKKDTTPPYGSNSVPLTGGVTILLVAGLGLGAKVMYDKNKKKKHAEQPVI